MRIPAAIVALALVSCASPPRAPASSCMQQTLDSLDLSRQSNDRKHCVASGSIALRCGTGSAWAAGYAKELADLLGPGNFQRRDLRANSAGRRCAGASAREQDLAACCGSAGF
ncbi:MAG: hypothetical protein ABL989_14505 [Gammaproteobacteria bacterium]